MKCRKCGSGEIRTRYYPPYDERNYEQKFSEYCSNEDEHLHRFCRDCHYSWCDPCLDEEAPDDK